MFFSFYYIHRNAFSFEQQNECQIIRYARERQPSISPVIEVLSGEVNHGYYVSTWIPKVDT